MTRLLLSVLAVLFLSSTFVVHVDAHLLHNLRRSLVTCTVEELADACPDDSIEFDKLTAECAGTHGVHAAVCYMQYLCRNHNQDTVNDHKECINNECPLAKHAPTLNCENYLATVDAAAEEAAVTDATKPSMTTTDAPVGDEGEEGVRPPSDASGETGGPPPDVMGPTNSTTLGEEEKEEVPPSVTEGGGEPIEPEELITMAGVTVAEPVESSSETESSESSASESETTTTTAPTSAEKSGMSTAAKLGIVLLVVAAVAFLFRGRLFAPKEKYPFDTHIGNTDVPSARIT